MTLWCSDKGNGAPVLFVHGASLHGPMWAAALEPLTDSHRVVVPTRRGYPGSPPPPRDWGAHTEDMIGVLDSHGIGSASVVGHGVGCVVALDLAIRHPERVERLVLLDATVRLERLRKRLFRRTCRKVELLRRWSSARRAIDAWFRALMAYWHYGAFWGRGLRGSAWRKMPEERREALRANAAGVFADLASARAADGRVDEQALRSLRVAVTICAGDNSAVQRPGWEEAGYLGEAIPNAEPMPIGSASHDVAFDQPDELIRTLRFALVRKWVDRDICAACGRRHGATPEYLQTVCDECLERASDSKGRRVELTLTPGIQALHRDDGSECREVTESRTVFVDGKGYRVTSNKFDVIVVCPFDDEG